MNQRQLRPVQEVMNQYASTNGNCSAVLGRSILSKAENRDLTCRTLASWTTPCNELVLIYGRLILFSRPRAA